MHSGGVSMIRRQNRNLALPFSSFTATRQFRVVAEMGIKYECWKIDFEANYIQRNAAPTVEQSIWFVTIRSVSSNFSHHFRRKNAFHGPRRYEPRVRQLHAIGTAEGHQPARSGIFVSSIDLFKSRSSDRKEKKMDGEKRKCRIFGCRGIYWSGCS